MAYFVATGDNLGIELNNQSATQLFSLGTHAYGNQGTEWIYLQANSSISARTMIAFTGAGSAGMASGSDLLAGYQLATAQTTVSVSSYFWAAIRGIGLTVLTTGSVTAVANPSGVIMLAASGVPTGVLVQGQGSGSGGTSGILAGIAFTDATNQTATSTYTVATLAWPAGAAVGM